MIGEVKLKSFKSYPESSIPFKPLTLLSGLNNSGKSSLIQAVRMYIQAENESSPLLNNHGEVRDMHSRLSSPKDSIEITCTFADNHTSSLRLTEDENKKPDRSPLSFYVSADRLGPQTVLPLRRAFSAFPEMIFWSLSFIQVMISLTKSTVTSILSFIFL